MFIIHLDKFIFRNSYEFFEATSETFQFTATVLATLKLSLSNVRPIVVYSVFQNVNIYPWSGLILLKYTSSN